MTGMFVASSPSRNASVGLARFPESGRADAVAPLLIVLEVVDPEYLAGVEYRSASCSPGRAEVVVLVGRRLNSARALDAAELEPPDRVGEPAEFLLRALVGASVTGLPSRRSGVATLQLAVLDLDRYQRHPARGRPVGVGDTHELRRPRVDSRLLGGRVRDDATARGAGRHDAATDHSLDEPSSTWLWRVLCRSLAQY